MKQKIEQETRSNASINSNIEYVSMSNYDQINSNDRKRSRFSWKKLNLSWKASLLALSISIISIGLSGAMAYYFASNSIKSTIEQLEKARVTDLQNTVNLFMQDRFGDIQVMATLEIFANPQLRNSSTTLDKEKVLNNLRQIYKIYDSIAVFDYEGNLIAQTEGKPLDNHANRLYIKAAKNANGAVISQPLVSKTEGNFNIYTASTIQDQVSGQPIGFIRARMPVENLAAILEDYQNQLSEYYLINGSGEVFLSPEGTYVGQTQSTGEEVVNAQFEYKATKATEIFSNLEQLENRDIVTIVVGENKRKGEEQLLAYSPPSNIAALPKLNWRAIIASDTEILFQPQRELRNNLLLGILITGVIIGAMAFYIANLATRPLLTAVTAVKKLGQGELDTRLEVKGADELAMLANYINLMAERIQQLLERQTAENRQTQLLAEVARARKEQDLHYPLNQLMEEIRSIFQADRIVIYRFQSNGRNYVAFEAVVPGWPNSLEVVEFGDCIPQETLARYKQGRVLANNNVFEANFHPEHLQLMERLQIKSNLIVPILQGENLFGLLIAHHCSQFHQWQQWEKDYLKQIGERLGQAFTSYTLFEQKIAEAEQEHAQNRAIQQDLVQLLADVEEASSGNLTVRAKMTENQIGIVADFFNAILESMQDIVTQVKQSTTQVNSSLKENDVEMQSLAKESLRQAKKIQRMVEFGEEMASSISNVASNAAEAAAMARNASVEAQKGGESIDLTVENILQLRSTVAETAKKVKRLGESSQQISKVISLINQIALQTNLLAINASIEAARAGEEGSGFAVVAEEVGELAAQSAAATKEIEQIVENIQAETQQVVEAMEVGTTQVVEGTNLVEKTRASLAQIVEVSRQIDQLFQDISGMTGSQAETSQMIIKLMQEIAKNSESSSISSRQVSSSLVDTVSIAGQLQQYVGKFKVD